MSPELKGSAELCPNGLILCVFSVFFPFIFVFIPIGVMPVKTADKGIAYEME